MVYFLKINVAIALFYAFYRLFFYKDTFFAWRRTALLCFFAVSAAVPLLDIQTWITQQEPMAAMADLYATVVLPELTLTPQPETDWKQLLADGIGTAYWLVAALLALRFLVRLAGIIRLARRCPTQKIDGTTVHLLPRSEGPFSFFRWIFVCPEAHTADELNEILTHERTHARQWHSIDVLTGELACIICWFNPFAWLMKREIRTNLEYMADEKVLETGHDSRTYQYHLLGLSHHKAAATIYNSFNVLPLKKRIIMMNKRRTRAIGRTKYLMFLPLAALLMVVSNIEAVARATQKITTEVAEAVAPGLQQETAGLVTYKGKVVDRNGQPIEGVQIVILTKDKSHKVLDECSQADGSFLFKAAPDARIGFVYMNSSTTEIQTINSESWGPSREKTIVLGGKPTAPSPAPTVSDKEVSETVGQIFEVVEQMPEFPDGGMAGMMKYLSSHIRYPEAAHKAGTQGRVTVQFVVSKDGSIGNVHILRGVSPELDAEAIRVISAMPKWKPGMQKGEPVSVKYTVPVMFRLQGTPEVQTQPYGTIEKISEVYVTGYGNNKSYTPVDIVEIADEMPQFPGGEKGLMEYLAKHIKYPVLAQEGKKQGRVVVEIVIDTEGRVRNSRIVQGVDTYLDAEALRVTNAMPKWKPGMKDGKPVSVKYSFPITFRLQ